MPLSEFHRILTEGKHELSQPRIANCSPELSQFIPDQDFVELLWENGQVVMHGQSDRLKKSSFTNNLPPHSGKFRERECRDAVIQKIGHFGEGADPVANEFAPTVPSAPIGRNAEDEEMVPWMNYQMEDSLQSDYCSDIFQKLSGGNLSSFSTHNNVVPADRSSSFGHIIRDPHNMEHGHAPKSLAGGLEYSRVRSNQLFQSSQQCQSSVLNTESRASEFDIAGSRSIHQDSSRNLHDRSLCNHELGVSKIPKASNGVGLMNFSNFSRPIAMVRSSLQTVDRLRSNEKASTATSGSLRNTDTSGSNDFNSPGAQKSYLSAIQSQFTSVPPEVEWRGSVKPPQEVIHMEQSETGCLEDTSRNKHISNITSTKPPDHVNCQSSIATTGMPLVMHEVEKGPDAVVASSSVCSANSAGEDSNELKHTAKRKTREAEEFGYQSEDLEDESIGIKKHANVRSVNAKRSRAAEVHNLSERRRRDRINEKMRALQELIPNCNKVDKASMLDEAIEYLKTLQLQVQIMSMGSGLCMSPMMLPAGMQHLRPHPMAHFSPIGMNMGMGGIGFGYGMGLIDMNGSAGCALTPMHRPQFPCPPMPVSPSFHAMPGTSSLQMFGIPGQGHPDPVSHQPAFAGLSQKMNQMPEILRATSSPLLVANLATPSENAKDLEQQNMILESKTGASNPQIQTSTQDRIYAFEAPA